MGGGDGVEKWQQDMQHGFFLNDPQQRQLLKLKPVDSWSLSFQQHTSKYNQLPVKSELQKKVSRDTNALLAHLPSPHFPLTPYNNAATYYSLLFSEKSILPLLLTLTCSNNKDFHFNQYISIFRKTSFVTVVGGGVQHATRLIRILLQKYTAES